MGDYYPSVEYITAEALAEELRSKPVKTVILDVRDDDYVGGNIKGAVNIPSELFYCDDDVEQAVERFKDADRIVFHCMKSQVRGPSCAKRFMNRVNILLEGEEKKPKVMVLQGGFERFVKLYAKDEELIENYNPRYWIYDD